MQHYNYFQYEKPNLNFEKPDRALTLGNTFPLEYEGYKNYVPTTPNNLTEKEALMWDIQKYAFVCNDLGLHLDLHPTDMKALKYYNENLEKLTKVKEEFERRYYPLTKTSKEIMRRPWPWINDFEGLK